jgi:hypothetical protein
VLGVRGQRALDRCELLLDHLASLVGFVLEQPGFVVPVELRATGRVLRMFAPKLREKVEIGTSIFERWSRR